MTCTLCGDTDHNRRTCENTPDELKARPPSKPAPAKLMVDVWLTVESTGRVIGGYQEWRLLYVKIPTS